MRNRLYLIDPVSNIKNTYMSAWEMFQIFENRKFETFFCVSGEAI